jgi:hypothetical protein
VKAGFGTDRKKPIGEVKFAGMRLLKVTASGET